MTDHKPFPANPDLRMFRNEVEALVNEQASKGDGAALAVADARNLVAREYGFDDWDALRTAIEPSSTHTARSQTYDAAYPPDHDFFKAVGALDLDRVGELLSQDPTFANADVDPLPRKTSTTCWCFESRAHFMPSSSRSLGVTLLSLCFLLGSVGDRR